MKQLSLRLFAALLALMLCAAFAVGCAKTSDGGDATTPAAAEGTSEESTTVQPAAPTTVRVATLKGPTGMGMAKLMDDAKQEGTLKNTYEFTVASAPTELTASIIKGDFDIAALPTNLAATLYQKTGGAIKVAAVNTLGVLYVLENGETVQSIADLRGKTLYATGQGSTPEYILRYILEKNGIDPEKDLTIEYMTEHSELATAMAAGTVSLGVLPEPNVTTAMVQNADLRVALDLTKEWEAAAPGTTVMQGCIVVSTKFAEEQPQALAEFLQAYKASVSYINENPNEGSALIEAAGIIPKAVIAKKALKNCNITYIDGEEMQQKLAAFLQVLYDASAASVGGKLPDDGFYLRALAEK